MYRYYVKNMSLYIIKLVICITHAQQRSCANISNDTTRLSFNESARRTHAWNALHAMYDEMSFFQNDKVHNFCVCKLHIINSR